MGKGGLSGIALQISTSNFMRRSHERSRTEPNRRDVSELREWHECHLSERALASSSAVQRPRPRPSSFLFVQT